MDNEMITINLSTNNCNNSINYIKQQIEMKNSNNVYFANQNMIKHSITDMNKFPYRYFYRGNFNENPTIFDRETGYQQRVPTISDPVQIYNSKQELLKDIEEHTPKVCFTTSRRTRHRCIASEESEKNNIEVNKQIIHNNSI